MEFNPQYLPHNFEHNCIVYPGTHDNNTTVGYYWEPERTEVERHNIRRYFRTDAHEIAWDFIWGAWSSVADLAVATLQDVFSLGAEARMNFPSRARAATGTGATRRRCSRPTSHSASPT